MEIGKDKSVLIFSPHHDDESIGCGGTIKLMTDNGCEVNLAVVTAGKTGVKDKKGETAIEIREQETRQAAQILGIRKIIFMKLRDHALIFNEENLFRFIHLIRELHPEIIYLPNEKEMDRDHRIVNELGNEAIWMASDETIFSDTKAVQHRIRKRLFEIWTPMLEPRLTIPIDRTWQVKEEAIRCYQSQLKTRNYINMAKGLNMFRAIQQCTQGNLAESFK